MRMAGRDVVEVNKETKVCELRKVNTQITLQRTRRSTSREPDTASIFLGVRDAGWCFWPGQRFRSSRLECRKVKTKEGDTRKTNK